MFYNKSLKELNLPDVETIGNEFCRRNIVLTELQLPKVKNIGHYFCSQNSSIIKFNAPNLENVGVEFLKYHVHLKSLIIPKIKNIESIVCLLYSKISLDVLILNDELMNSNYPLVLSYKKNLLLEEKTNKTVSSNNSLSLALKEIKNNIHN